MNPKVDHNDKESDMPTTQKREIKRKRLGCELITVNMLDMDAAEWMKYVKFMEL